MPGVDQDRPVPFSEHVVVLGVHCQGSLEFLTKVSGIPGVIEISMGQEDQFEIAGGAASVS